MIRLLILAVVLLAATSAQACSIYRASNWPLRGFTYRNDCGPCTVYRTEGTRIVWCPEPPARRGRR